MSHPRLLFVSGKGGVGKTTVSAALGSRAAADGQRVLIVELSADRSLAALFGKRQLKLEPTSLAANLHAVRVETRALVEAYFTRLLRLPFLTRRLFASNTFNALTTGAPGVTEFLVLEHLLQWLEPGFLTHRRSYDLIIVDAPATGHALRLLRTPWQLASMVPAGPVGSAARKLLTLLTDHRRTQVVMVTIPDEMAVNETLEAHAVVDNDLTMRLTRPVLNRVFPRRFTHEDAERIGELSAEDPSEPLLAAARLQIATRHDAERHLSRMRRAFGLLPVSLRQVCADGMDQKSLGNIGGTLARALL